MPRAAIMADGAENGCDLWQVFERVGLQHVAHNGLQTNRAQLFRARFTARKRENPMAVAQPMWRDLLPEVAATDNQSVPIPIRLGKIG
jgi:hypothetical protein